MKALVYQGPGMKSWEEKPVPVLRHPMDAIVRIMKTTICGTDLQILRGAVTEVKPGTTLGHEGVGMIESIGSAVNGFKPGDHVLISCVTSCGACNACRKGMYAHCQNGGWMLGHLIDGTQADYVRIPYAETSLYHIPVDTDGDTFLTLCDILPTGYECRVFDDTEQTRDQVAITGTGTVAPLELRTVQLYSPTEIIMIDPDANRLEIARKFAATHTLNKRKDNPTVRIIVLTAKNAVGTINEAVDLPATSELWQQTVKSGGHIAMIGIYGAVAMLYLERIRSRNSGITTRLVDTSGAPLLLEIIKNKDLMAKKLDRQRFTLDQIELAYTNFQEAAVEHPLKVQLTAT